MIATAIRLNLGAADRVIPGFISVDIAPPADVVTDLALPWPWPDSSVEEVVAYDLAEHIEDFCRCCSPLRGGVRSGRIHFMNELHRVLVHGGRASIEVPSATHGSGFAQDPTHAQPYTLNSFQYFRHESFAVGRLAKAYGINARFKVLSLAEREYQDDPEMVWKITAVLQAVK